MNTYRSGEYDVVIVGSGFGGVAAARRLARSDKSVLMISADAHYLFQPLLYQVATGVLDADTVAPDAQSIVPDGVDVQAGAVTAIDPESSTVTYRADGRDIRVRYGSLIAATGASQSYFGHDEYADRTFALKTRDDAVRLRDRIVRNFERPHDRAASTYVVVGAGATGVELAGEIAELARRHHRTDVSITLIDGLDEVLPAFGGGLSKYARSTLERAGVEVLLRSLVTDIEPSGQGESDVVTIDVDHGSATRAITASTVIWSAGVRAAGFADVLAAATGCDIDKAGRLLVNPDLTVGGFANVYAIGDMTSLHGYPGQSPVAMQEGRHAADIITRNVAPGTRFRYFDKGSMSMIGRGKAVAQLTERITFRGPLAWVAWLAVHLYYLAGFGNRVHALRRWAASFLGNARRGFDEIGAAEADEQRRSEPMAG